jgi:hypothetical protein
LPLRISFTYFFSTFYAYLAGDFATDLPFLLSSIILSGVELFFYYLIGYPFLALNFESLDSDGLSFFVGPLSSKSLGDDFDFLRSGLKAAYFNCFLVICDVSSFFDVDLLALVDIM